VTKMIFFRFFFLTGGFCSFFFLLVICLLLSICDHHFLRSRFAHRLNPCTNFCIHLEHIPAHPPAPSLCMLRLVFPAKLLSPPRAHAILEGNQPLELLVQRQWDVLSRWIFFCRSPSISTTCLSYNFPHTSLVLFLGAGKCTQLFQPPLLGRRGKTPKQGAELLFLSLLSLSPFSPNASLMFPPFVRHIFPH
jgi:hypothetical protein